MVILADGRLSTLSGRPTFSEADVAANDGCPARLAFTRSRLRNCASPQEYAVTSTLLDPVRATA